MTLLIDADYIVYKACAAVEEDYDFGNDVIFVVSSFKEAMHLVNRDLNNIANNLGCFDDSILFFSSARNFRKDISPDYKGHRQRKKPCGYRRVIEALKEDFHVVTEDGLEADDLLGIYATRESGHVICSPDKDLKQIPGDLYDMKNEVVTITPEEGREWFYIQTMAGDMTDGYSGIPGIGVKRAATILEKNGCTWDTVLDAFLDKGMSEEDALTNARLARILTHDLYESGRITYWTPTNADLRADRGTGVQNKTLTGSTS